jgi:hypothetical protein
VRPSQGRTGLARGYQDQGADAVTFFRSSLLHCWRHQGRSRRSAGDDGAAARIAKAGGSRFYRCKVIMEINRWAAPRSSLQEDAVINAVVTTCRCIFVGYLILYSE